MACPGSIREVASVMIDAMMARIAPRLRQYRAKVSFPVIKFLLFSWLIAEDIPAMIIKSHPPIAVGKLIQDPLMRKEKTPKTSERR